MLQETTEGHTEGVGVTVSGTAVVFAEKSKIERQSQAFFQSTKVKKKGSIKNNNNRRKKKKGKG